MLAAVVALALASPAAEPEQLALPGYRLHLIAPESLHPDRLRALARPGVTLWLRTSSNALRDSTVENLRRFERAFVELRPPLASAHLRQLERAPAAGVWIAASAIGGGGLHRLGARPLAIQLTGELGDEMFMRVKDARPAAVVWEAPAVPDLLSLGRLRQLPGAKLAVVPGLRLGAASAAVGCRPAAGAPRLWVDARGAAGPEAWPVPCSLGARVRVDPAAKEALLRALHLRDPAVELEVEVMDEDQALGAERLLETLARASVGGRSGER